MAIDLVSALAGLGVGVGVGVWQQARQRSRLRQILSPLLDEVVLPLGVEALVRRGVATALDRELFLESQLEIWENALADAPVAFLWIDRDDGLRWCNDRARELFAIRQWQPQQDRLLIEVVRSYDLDQLVQQTRRGRSSCQQEWTFYPDRLADYGDGGAGERSALEPPVMPPSAGSEGAGIALRGWGVPLAHGHVAIFVENCQQMVDLARSRNRWLNDLAHELRTPLTSIQLVFETLQKQLDPPLSHWVDRAMPEVKRLVRFVQDWLDLSQMEQNPGQILRLEVLDLVEVAQAAWQSVEPLAERKSISLVLDRDGLEHLWLQGDRAKLHRLLLNLLDNAIKYSPTGGSIWLHISQDAPALDQPQPAIAPPGEPIEPPTRVASESVESDDSEFVDSPEATWAYADVIDAGPGFSPIDLPHIFERLYRGDASRTRDTELMLTSQVPSTGSGLGLAIARQIAIAHGGQITGSNDPTTGGARLRLALPIRTIEQPLDA
ncbi:MAG TPA: HAMP domain-containing sensor histidine kinase [Coleofasciculaceae cyanobacterium]